MPCPVVIVSQRYKKIQCLWQESVGGVKTAIRTTHAVGPQVPKGCNGKALGTALDVARKLRGRDREGRLRPFPPQAVLGPCFSTGSQNPLFCRFSSRFSVPAASGGGHGKTRGRRGCLIYPASTPGLIPPAAETPVNGRDSWCCHELSHTDIALGFPIMPLRGNSQVGYALA
jgi:hypothetical protein